MTKFLFLLIGVLLNLSSYSQYNSITPHGTLVIGIVCTDGIILASDSRSSFEEMYGTTKRIYAYFDNAEKIMPLGKYYMAIVGAPSIDHINTSYFAALYNKKANLQLSVEATFNQFQIYLESVWDVKQTHIIKGENQYILAGYENGMPFIYDFQKPLVVVNSGGVESHNGFLKLLYSKRPFQNAKCQDVVKTIHETFYEFVKKNNLKGIGGPLHIIQILPDNSKVELENYKPINYISSKQLDILILTNKIPMTYLYRDSEKKLKDGLSKYVKSHP